MQTLLCLLLATGASFVRFPQKAAAPGIESRLVWVFFTDKGIYSETDCAVALSALGRPPATSRAPDFDDVPVREAYIRAVERMGARRRTVSNWLNAASFDMPPGLAQEVFSLPFVHDLKPVISRTATEPGISPLARASTLDQHRAADTAYAHRFYGPSYDQAQMMGVPDLFFRGFFGSNVKLAIFDTGLKLTNRGISRVRIYKQHDFLSGDNCYSASWSETRPAAPVENIRYHGLVKDPVVYTVQSQSGSKDTLVLAFCADSFAYGYNPPRRAVFAAHSTDAGRTWDSPVAVVLATPYTNTFENLVMAGHGYVTYLAYSDLVAQNRAPASARIYLGHFVGTNWQGSPAFIAAGRYPAVDVLGDTLYLAFVQSDTTVMLWKASVVLPEPSPLLISTFSAGEPLAGVQVAAGANGVIDIISTGLKSGRMAQFRSTDGGGTFTQLNELKPAGAANARLTRHSETLLLVYEDRSQTVLSRLASVRSDDGGSTWSEGGMVADRLFAVGGFSVVTSVGADSVPFVSAVFEAGGFTYRSRSEDFGRTWTEPGPVDTTGFNTPPVLAAMKDDALALWFKRGDDNAVWEASDTARFSREQSDHGTRMASIIAGYQQGAVVGVAPGVDLLVAKTELHKVKSGRFYEYTMEEDAYVQALEWADRMGASIVSTSLGYRSWYGEDQFDGKTAPISIAASIAAQRGLLIVTAMGNRDTSQNPWPEPYIVAPGDAEGVITAGGVEKNMLPWRGTGTGPTSDGRVKPDLVALSDTVAVVSPDSEDYLDGSVGTSCATALIAGACALVKEAHPQWSADSIKAVLFATATRSVKSCTFGFGVPRIDSVFKLYPPEKGIEDVTGDEIGAIFPNPFAPPSQARVYFQVNLTRPASEAVIRIYTVSGALIDTVTLNAALMSRPGRYGDNGDVALLERLGAFWDGRNEAGKPVAAGLYVAVLQTTFDRHAARFALVR